MPKLKHVIYVDQKKIITEGYPAGLSIHSMQTVLELGALPQNSVYFSIFVSDSEVGRYPTCYATR